MWWTFCRSFFDGAPPGYVGYEEGGQLTEKVRRKPYSIVLLIIQAALCRKTNATSKFFQLTGSYIGSHDNNSIFEIYHSAITVSQTTFIHNLKQDVEHIRMIRNSREA